MPASASMPQPRHSRRQQPPAARASEDVFRSLDGGAALAQASRIAGGASMRDSPSMPPTAADTPACTGCTTCRINPTPAPTAPCHLSIGLRPLGPINPTAADRGSNALAHEGACPAHRGDRGARAHSARPRRAAGERDSATTRAFDARGPQKTSPHRQTQAAFPRRSRTIVTQAEPAPERDTAHGAQLAAAAASASATRPGRRRHLAAKGSPHTVPDPKVNEGYPGCLEADGGGVDPDTRPGREWRACPG